MEVNKGIIIWCGNAPNQKALVNKIHKQFEISAIVIDKKQKIKSRKIQNLGNKILDRILFGKIYNAWSNLLRYYDKRFPHWPNVPILKVENINKDEVFNFTNNYNPSLILVSGTGLIKDKLLTIKVSKGIMNLHTGLSPYVKGGPNCTNWCIANNEWHLIGNTIMWINEGIDTGNIITSEAIDIKESTSLGEAHKTVMEHAHDLYLRAIHFVLNNDPPYLSVPQSELGAGNLYLNKMWTTEAKTNMLRNWKNRQYSGNSSFIKTIPLPAS